MDNTLAGLAGSDAADPCAAGNVGQVTVVGISGCDESKPADALAGASKTIGVSLRLLSSEFVIQTESRDVVLQPDIGG